MGIPRSVLKLCKRLSPPLSIVRLGGIDRGLWKIEKQSFELSHQFSAQFPKPDHGREIISILKVAENWQVTNQMV